jgi:hypothetical protein
MLIAEGGWFGNSNMSWTKTNVPWKSEPEAFAFAEGIGLLASHSLSCASLVTLFQSEVA